MKSLENKASAMPPVFLVGPRCSGKSSVGRGLARHMGLTYTDTDIMIVEQAGMSIAEIVARDGWQSFRNLESIALNEAAVPGCVVSTGGGMILDANNRRFMRDTGIVFYLSAPLETLCERFTKSRLNNEEEDGQRPSLTGADPVAEFAMILEEREPIYRACAHHAIDASRPLAEVIGSIARIVRRTKRNKQEQSDDR